MHYYVVHYVNFEDLDLSYIITWSAVKTLQNLKKGKKWERKTRENRDSKGRNPTFWFVSDSLFHACLNKHTSTHTRMSIVPCLCFIK